MKIFKLLAVGILLCCLALVLPGCATKKEKALRYFQANPYDLAEICAEKYPVKVGPVQAGKETVRYDTVYTPADSIPCPPDASGKVVYVKGKDGKTVYRDRLRVDTIRIENTAAVESAKAKGMDLFYQLKTALTKVDQLGDEVKGLKRRNLVLLIWAIAASGLFVWRMFK